MFIMGDYRKFLFTFREIYLGNKDSVPITIIFVSLIIEENEIFSSERFLLNQVFKNFNIFDNFPKSNLNQVSLTLN
jgi:hypothetical protein